MRTHTKAHIAAAQSAQEADDRLAQKLSSLLSYIQKEERSRADRDSAMIQAIKEDQSNYFGELRVMRSEISAVMAELRGLHAIVETNHEEMVDQSGSREVLAGAPRRKPKAVR